jgi:hypothetical protein
MFIHPVFLSLLVNRYVIAGVVAVGLLAGAYLKGYMAARDACQDSSLKAQIAAMQRDIDAFKAASEIEAMLQAEIEAERNQLERRLSDYERELASRPDGRCILDERDVDGLRLDGRR